MDRTRADAAEETSARVDRLVAPGGLTVEYQPIVRLGDGAVVAYEALSRDATGELTPDELFAAAAAIGRKVEVERACLEAIAAGGAPPGDALLFVNVSPALLAGTRCADLRQALPSRLVLELTEQEEVTDPEALRTILQPWVRNGTRLAVDDAGAGYSSLKQVVDLGPEFLKVDRSLVAGIHRDRRRQAVMAALVAFASEIGADVIAEGIEHRSELGWLRSAGVTLAQGFLLARPGPPWPPVTSIDGLEPARPRRRGLVPALDEARTQRGACEAVTAHLFRRGGLMPSAYLERAGRLRCQAQRGLWQVLDGMVPSAGITGRTFRTGIEHHVEDVRQAEDYLEAIPGVVAELCVPLVADGTVVGALNVESLVPLSDEVQDEVRSCARLLGDRLVDLPPEQSRGPLRRLAETAASLAAVEDADRTIDAVLRAATDLSGMDSALLVLHDGDRPRTATGPLAAALETITPAEIDHLRAVLGPLTSCYSAGEATGRTVTASQTLRDAGARSLVALPIAARGRRMGLLVVTHRDPYPLGPEQVEPLELLAVLAGSCLETAATVEELRRRAQRDPLTGLGNHSSFHERLLRAGERGTATVLVLDIDDFKLVNDTGGHLVGDEVLRTVGADLLAALPEADAAFRIGGDEFAVVLEGDDAASPEVIAATLQDAVGGALRDRGAGLSIGAARRRGTEPLIETLQRADTRLYRSKADKAARPVA
jgi:diguanylate cyclase (GGDEF)-like protein